MTLVGVSLMRCGSVQPSVFNSHELNAISQVGDAAGKMLSESKGQSVGSMNGLSKTPEDLMSSGFKDTHELRAW